MIFFQKSFLLIYCIIIGFSPVRLSKLFFDKCPTEISKSAFKDSRNSLNNLFGAIKFLNPEVKNNNYNPIFPAKIGILWYSSS